MYLTHVSAWSYLGGAGMTKTTGTARTKEGSLPLCFYNGTKGFVVCNKHVERVYSIMLGPWMGQVAAVSLHVPR